MIESFWSDKSVFVTGASGFLGSWLVKSLKNAGANIFSLGSGRIEDYDLLADILKKNSIDTVFHLAAQSIVAGGQQDPRSTFETNIRGTWNILEASRITDSVKRLVIASSSHAYGQHDRLPLLETYPLQGIYPYDVSKSAADMIARSYIATFNMPIVVVRSGAFYGGGDLNFSRVVPGTIRRILRGEQPLIRGTGNARRDLLFVQDVVDAYIMLAERAADSGVGGEVFNVGSDEPVSARMVVEKILECTGSTLEPNFIKDSLKEVSDMYVSSEKIKNIIGWRQGIPLEDGLERTIMWYRQNTKL